VVTYLPTRPHRFCPDAGRQTAAGKYNRNRISIDKKGLFKFSTKFSDAKNDKNLLGKNGILDNESLDWAAKSVSDMYDILVAQNQVDAEKVFIVGSSSIPQKSQAALAKKVNQSLQGAGKNAQVVFLNAEKETEMLIKGTLPEKFRFSSALVDIGSGNTKIGYLTEDQKLSTLSIAYGTESVHQQAQKQGGNYTNAVKALLNSKISPELKKQIQTKTLIQSRKEICLVGGAVWALATFLKPETAKESFVELKAEDISKFRNMATLEYAKLSKPDLSKISNSEIKAQAIFDIDQINKDVFDQQSIIAGAMLLEAVVNEFDAKSQNKRLYFARNGYLGWVTGYVTTYIEDRYKKLQDD